MGVLKKIGRELGLVPKRRNVPAPPPPQPSGPSAAEVQQQLQEAQRQAAALEAERQRLEAERQRAAAAAAAHAAQVQQREEMQRQQEAARLAARQKAELAAAEERIRKESRLRRVPSFLQESDWRSKVNVAVVGNTGVGKSLFINACRGVQSDHADWSPVGVVETTMSPKPFKLPNDERAWLWDIPGAGTTNFPLDEYICTFGLRHFDIGIIISTSRFTQTELLLQQELQTAGKPTFFVRSKIDLDIRNNEADNQRSPIETKDAISAEFRLAGILNPYLISSRQISEHDFNKLMCDLSAACRSVTRS